MSSFAESSIDSPVAPLRKKRIVKNIEQSDYRGVIRGHRRIVQRELRADAQFVMIADVRDAGCRHDCRKGLARGSSDQLIVVEFTEHEEVSKGPFESNVLDVVAQVGHRVFNHGVGKEIMARLTAQGRQITDVTLKSQRPQIFEHRQVWQVAHAFLPKEFRTEAGVALIANIFVADRQIRYQRSRGEKLMLQ